MRVAALLALVALFSGPAQAQDAYQAALTGGNEVPAVATDAYGIARVFLADTTVTVSGSFTGLSSAYLFSHIHRGAADENGPVAVALTAGLSADQTEGSWEFADNTFEVSRTLADSIAGGLTYVNVHSQTNPGGEIRAQIVSSARTADVLLTGVFDGPVGGSPKVVELYVLGEVADLSRYAIGTANGGETDVSEFVLPKGAQAGSTFVTVADDAAAFTTYFGAAPTLASDAVSFNGDDAVELFYDADANGDFARTEVVDVFGEATVDGTGRPWEYTDGWAYRRAGTDVGGDIFTAANWTVSGLDVNDGKTSNTDPDAFPLGAYAPAAAVARLQVIHNSPDPAADTVDVYVNDALFLDDVPFRGASAFVDVPANVALEVDITANDAADSSAPVFTTALTLDADSSYQVIATGVLGSGFSANPDGVDTAFTLLLTPTFPQEFALGAAFVRFIHGTPDAPSVDVSGTFRGTGNSTPTDIAEGAEYTSVTDAVAGPPGAALEFVTLTASGGGGLLGNYSFASPPGGASATTLLASGFLTPEDDNNGPGFELLAVDIGGATELLLVTTTPNSEDDARAAGMDLRSVNPIAHTATVRFDTGVAGRTTLEVVDVLGRRVATLLDEAVAPGARTARLDASTLAPGIYVLRLAGEAGVLTQTITVVR